MKCPPTGCSEARHFVDFQTWTGFYTQSTNCHTEWGQSPSLSDPKILYVFCLSTKLYPSFNLTRAIVFRQKVTCWKNIVIFRNIGRTVLSVTSYEHNCTLLVDRNKIHSTIQCHYTFKLYRLSAEKMHSGCCQRQSLICFSKRKLSVFHQESTFPTRTFALSYSGSNPVRVSKTQWRQHISQR